MSIAIELFLIGLTLGMTQCVFLCAPMLVPYIASTKRGWKEGLFTTLIFSLSRLSAYILLGSLAGLFGVLIIELLHRYKLSYYLWTVGGLFIILLGVLIILGKDTKSHFCQVLHQQIIGKSNISMALLGFVFSFKLCPALLAVLSYIALKADNALTGAFYGLCFGLGAAVVTPLIIFGIIASTIPAMIFETPKIYKFFKRFCGVLLVIFGLRIIFGI